MVDKDLDKLDLYGLLDVAEDASEKEILKAYRKKALKCHPDKNPDNPKAAEEFHQLSRALEVLSDKAARKAYDNVVKARKAAEERHKALDDKRKKFKEDLEAREKKLIERENMMAKRTAEDRAAAGLKAEIDRLKKEGNSLLQQEQERLQAEMKAGLRLAAAEATSGSATLKIKWMAAKDDDLNGGYDDLRLTKIFTKYGNVKTIIISAKKKGSALIEFERRDSASLAHDNEIGLPENPLKISWVEGNKEGGKAGSKTSSGHSSPAPQPPSSAERDFESLVMRKMRQAEERKRLIEQMQKDDS